MAIIQELAPELLIRIIELVPDGHLSFDERAETRRTLARAALVARDWLTPAQYVLASTFEAVTNAKTWKKYLRSLSNPRAAPMAAPERLVVVHGADLAEELSVLQRHHVRLPSLRVYYWGLHLTSRNYPLLRGEASALTNAPRFEPRSDLRYMLPVAGLRRLELSRPISVYHDFDPTAPMALEALLLHSSIEALPPFLLPFPTVVPRLTRIELDCSAEAFTREMMVTLPPAASQLTHLNISLPLANNSQFRRDCRSSLDSFLRACTSVTSLYLLRPIAFEIQQISSLLPKPLIVLHVYLLLGHDEATRMPAELVPVFNIPNLAQLRRWRMVTWVRGRGNVKCPWEDWEAACRARRIEPRGDERYVTGEPLLSSPSSDSQLISPPSSTD
jgi:hypothetical protein